MSTESSRNGSGSAIEPTGSVCDQHAEKILELLSAGRSTRQIAHRLGLKKSTVAAWVAGGCGDEYVGQLARARKANALVQVEDGGRLIDSVDPDAPTGSARVSKAREQAGHRRFVASKLDRETWGDKLDVTVEGKVALVAFADLTVRAAASEVIAQAYVMPHVAPPDGASCAKPDG